MRTEDELIAALREAAEAAPDADLLAGVARRRRRRTRRRAQVLAAAAVVAVIGTGVAVTQGYGPGRGEAPRPATTTTVTMPATAEPRSPARAAVTDLWPQALFTMPATNAEGWRYRPVSALSATEVLMAVETPTGRTGAFEIYDSEIGKARRIIEVPGESSRYLAQWTAVGQGHLAWIARREQADGTPVGDIWTAPLAGGEATLLTTRTGRDADVDAVAIDGGHILWSETDGAAVWRVPLSGGEPERLPGTEGLHLIGGPWASDVPEASEGNQTRLVNVAADNTVSLTAPPGVTHWRCGPAWCHGRKGAGMAFYRTDGAEARVIRQGDGPTLKPYPILGRFVPVGQNLYDLAADKLVHLANPGPWHGLGLSSEPTTIFYWGTTRTDNPDEPTTFQLLNLAAVPPAQ